MHLVHSACTVCGVAHVPAGSFASPAAHVERAASAGATDASAGSLAVALDRPRRTSAHAHERERGERGEGTRARSLTALIDSVLGEDPALNRVNPGWRGRARHLRPRRLLRTAAAAGGPADAEEEAHERDVGLAGTVSAPVTMDPVRQPCGSP